MSPNLDQDLLLKNKKVYDLMIMKVTMNGKKEIFSPFGLLLSAVILSNLALLCKAQEALDEDFLQQKMEENGMDPGSSQVFHPPTVTDEERGSHHMPKYLRCAGCVGVAHQFAAEYKKSKKKKLSLADQIDFAETVCWKRMIDYGLKEHKGKKMLSGPGLAASDIPGMMEGGGKWEARMKTLCMELIEEFEEEGVYEIYTELGSKDLATGLCNAMCRDTNEILSLKSVEEEPSTKKSEL